jgi:hypothetical protein
MKIRNDDTKAFIVSADIVIKGGEKAPDGTIFINPKQTVDVTDQAGARIVKMFPNITALTKPKKGAENVDSSNGK